MYTGSESSSLNLPLVRETERVSCFGVCSGLTTPYIVKTIVGGVVTLPFVLSTLNIVLKESFIIGLPMMIVAIPSIFRIGYIFYGQHVMELFTPQESIAHIAHDLSGDEQTDIPSWSTPRKIFAGILIIACTLPLGMTKIDLAQDSSQIELCGKWLYLLLHSAIDTLPHINHLPFWGLAVSKFRSFPVYLQIWVFLLMCAHAANDVADVWNSSGFLHYWIYLGFATEGLMSAVEAVAHYRFAQLKYDAVSMLNLLVMIVGAVSIAWLNWYNTFDSLSVSFETANKIVFVLLESFAALFFVFEVWNHDVEPCDHHRTSSALGLSLHSIPAAIHSVLDGERPLSANNYANWLTLFGQGENNLSVEHSHWLTNPLNRLSRIFSARYSRSENNSTAFSESQQNNSRLSSVDSDECTVQRA